MTPTRIPDRQHLTDTLIKVSDRLDHAPGSPRHMRQWMRPYRAVTGGRTLAPDIRRASESDLD